jgi:YVTN family beta-propeller protein
VRKILAVAVVLDLVLALAVVFGRSSGPVAEGSLWVVNTNGKSVTVVDLASSKVVETIPLPGKPHGIDLEPGGKRVWTSNIEGNSVSVIDVDTRKISKTIPVCDGPVAVAFAEGKAFAACGEDGYMDVINLTTLTVVHKEAVGYAPHAIISDPRGGFVWSVNRGTNDVSKIDAKTGVLKIRYGAGPFAYAAAFTRDGKYLFVTSKTWDAVSVLNTDDMRILGSVKVGNDPSLIVVSSDGKRVYTSNRLDGTVSVINGLTFQEIRRIKVGIEPDGLALTHDGKTLLVTNFGSDSVSVVDTTGGREIRTISVGDGPDDAVIVAT